MELDRVIELIDNLSYDSIFSARRSLIDGILRGAGIEVGIGDVYVWVDEEVLEMLSRVEEIVDDGEGRDCVVGQSTMPRRVVVSCGNEYVDIDVRSDDVVERVSSGLPVRVNRHVATYLAFLVVNYRSVVPRAAEAARRGDMRGAAGIVARYVANVVAVGLPFVVDSFSRLFERHMLILDAEVRRFLDTFYSIWCTCTRDPEVHIRDDGYVSTPSPFEPRILATGLHIAYMLAVTKHELRNIRWVREVVSNAHRASSARDVLYSDKNITVYADGRVQLTGSNGTVIEGLLDLAEM